MPPGPYGNDGTVPDDFLRFSAAVIPVTYQCLETKGRVDHRVSRFVIPVGATLNMNGMALYEAVACMFIAQLSGYDLSFGKMLLIRCVLRYVSTVYNFGVILKLSTVRETEIVCFL